MNIILCPKGKEKEENRISERRGRRIGGHGMDIVREGVGDGKSESLTSVCLRREWEEEQG